MSVDAPARPVLALRRAVSAGSTTPERLRRITVVVVVGCLAGALLSVLAGLDRVSSAREAQTRISALTADSAELYRSLADADAMATSGYVAGGREPTAVRARYDDDVARAAARLVDIAERLPDSAPVATVATQLPVYTGLVDTARALNRDGLPLGQSYLGSASLLMRTTILPAADELHRTQAAALTATLRGGSAIPFAVLLVLAAALAVIIDVSLRERRRTGRTVSVGLLAGAVALLAALAWWATASITTSALLADAERHGTAASVLDDARTAVLQARSSESLTLVARSGGFASDDDVTAQVDRVVGPGGLLARGDGGAPGSGERLTAVAVALDDWRAAHRQVRALDDGGNYTDAVASVTTTAPGSSRAAFERLDAALAAAIDAERAAFGEDADAAARAMTGLVVGPAVLALLAAAAATAGLGRRIGEYR